MSDPVGPDLYNDPIAVKHRAKYGQPQPQQTTADTTSSLYNDPIARAHRAKYSNAPPVQAAAPPPEDEGPGVIKRGLLGAKGAVRAGAEFVLSAPDFVEGAVLSPLASAYKLADPEGFERARKEAEGKPDYLHVPTMGELAKGLVTAPLESAKAALESTDPEEAGYNAAMTVLMSYGLYHGGKELVKKGKAKFGKTPPDDGGPPDGGPPAAAPTPPPGMVVPTIEEIAKSAVDERKSTKAATSEAISAGVKRAFAWKKMTPEERAKIAPGLPAADYTKTWNELSDASKQVLKDSWKPIVKAAEPAPTTPPTAGEAGPEAGQAPSGEYVSPPSGAVVGDIRPETAPGKRTTTETNQAFIDALNAKRAEKGLPPLARSTDPSIVGGIAPKGGIPEVQDLSRGTFGEQEKPSTPLVQEDVLKIARERGALTDQPTSGGTLGQPPVARTPEAEAVMAGRSADAIDAARRGEDIVLPEEGADVDAQLAALKVKMAKEGIPELKLDLKQVETSDLGRLGRKGEVVHEGEVKKYTLEDVRAELRRRIDDVKENVETAGTQHEKFMLKEEVDKIDVALNRVANEIKFRDEMNRLDAEQAARVAARTPKLEVVQGQSNWEAKLAEWPNAKIPDAKLKSVYEAMSSAERQAMFGGDLGWGKLTKDQIAHVWDRLNSHRIKMATGRRPGADSVHSDDFYKHAIETREEWASATEGQRGDWLESIGQSREHAGAGLDELPPDVMRSVFETKRPTTAPKPGDDAAAVDNLIAEVDATASINRSLTEAKGLLEELATPPEPPKPLEVRSTDLKPAAEVVGSRALEDIPHPNLKNMKGDPILRVRKGQEITQSVLDELKGAGVTRIPTEDGVGVIGERVRDKGPRLLTQEEVDAGYKLNPDGTIEPPPKPKGRPKETLDELRAKRRELQHEHDVNATGGREAIIKRIKAIDKKIEKARIEAGEVPGELQTRKLGAREEPAPKSKSKADTSKIFAGDSKLDKAQVQAEIDKVNEYLDAGLGDEDKALAKDRLKSLGERLKQLDEKPDAKTKVADPARELDQQETKNDRAFDKGEITEEVWGKEVNRIADARIALKKGTAAVGKAAPAPKTGPVLDPKGFRGRMKDNLRDVKTVDELEQRKDELNSRIRVDPGGKDTYQNRIGQINDELARRDEKLMHTFPSRESLEESASAVRALFNKRRVTNDVPKEQMSVAERHMANAVITEPDLSNPGGLTRSLREKWAQLVDSDAGYKGAAERIFGKGSSDAKKHEMLSEVSSGSLTRAEEAIRGQGMMIPDATGENWILTGTRSVHDILMDIPKLDGKPWVARLDRVWAALNTIEQFGRGKIVGPDFVSAVEFVKEAGPEYVKASMELRALNLDLVKYQVWGGLHEPSLIAKLESQRFYAPIRRLLAFEGTGEVVGTSGGKDVIKVANPLVRRLKGSKLPQQGPVETTIDNIYRVIRASELNFRLQDMAKGAKLNPEAARGVMEPASFAEQRAMQKTLGNKVGAIVAKAQAEGITLSREEAIAQLQKFSNENLNIENNMLHIWIDGKPTLWRISDELAYSAKHMQAQEYGLFTQYIGWVTGILHAGVVADPRFLLRNLTLDNFTGWVNSEYGFNPLKGDQIRGYLEIVRNSPWAKEFRLAGGGHTGLTGSRFRHVSTSLADAIRPRTAGPYSEALAQVKEIRPGEAWKTLVAPFEEAARVSEYIAGRQADATMLESVYYAKRITTNYQRGGGAMTATSHVVPFANATVQSLSQAYENFNRHPMRWVQRAFIASAIPAFTLWWINKDDKDIQRLRRSEGGSMYLFMRGPDGVILKQRKAYLEGAIFGTGMEAALDAAEEQSLGPMKDWGKAIGRELAFNPLATLGYVPASLFANKDIRTGIPIVPERMEDIAAGYRAGPYTGTSARIIGQKLDISPAQIEYGVRGFFGGAGETLMKSADVAIDYYRKGALPRITNTPIVNGFVAKYPTMSVRPVQEFYTNSDKMREVAKTIDYLKRKDPAGLKAHLEAHRNDMRLIELYSNARDQIAAIQRNINLLRDAPTNQVAQHEREKLIDSMIVQIITRAEIANKAAKNLSR